MIVQIAVEYESGQTVYITNGTREFNLSQALLTMGTHNPEFVVGYVVSMWKYELSIPWLSVFSFDKADFTLYLDPARQWIGLSAEPGIVEWWLPVDEFETIFYHACETLGNRNSDKNFWAFLVQLGYEARGTVTE